MKSKIFTITLLQLALLQAVSSQIVDPKVTLKNKVNNRINQKIEKGIDKGLDKMEESAKGDGSAKSKKETTADTSKEKKAPNPISNNFTVYSKYDFVPGEKIMAVETFDDDAVGDFPNFWNTNSSAEIVTVEGEQGKFLQMSKNGVFTPELIKSLPENFTLEFDVLVNPNFNYYCYPLTIGIANISGNGKITDWAQHQPNKHGLRLTLHPTGAANNEGNSSIAYFKKEESKATLENTVAVKQMDAHHGKIKYHISIWRQKERIRVYVNEEKVWDLPKILESNVLYNTLVFSTYQFKTDADRFLVGNLKLAVGAPDTRNKILTQGKFVSHGIQFDKNSATLKPESYGSIKDIANVLKENTEVKLKIVGHTDTDGDDKTNLELSKKRAQAVKDFLIKEFKIDASRLEVEGKGETAPIDNSNTAEAKASNRRVEFEKI